MTGHILRWLAPSRIHRVQEWMEWVDRKDSLSNTREMSPGLRAVNTPVVIEPVEHALVADKVRIPAL